MVAWLLNITAIEYFIWGIIDPMFGLFVYEVVGDYGTVGLIFGIRTIVSLASLWILQKIFHVFTPVQNLFLVNIFMVLFSISMFLAGFLHSSWLLFIMIALYGIIFSLKTFSRQNLLRASISPENFTQSISQSISIKYGAWILGMLVGGSIIMVWDGVPLYWLFVSIAGLWTFSLFPFFSKQNEIIKMREHNIHHIHSLGIPQISWEKIKNYFSSFPLIIKYNFSLFLFSELVGRVTLLFIPILGKSLNLHLSEIFWLTAFMVSPMIFTQFFSWLIKVLNKLSIIIISISLSLIPFWYLSQTDVPFWIAVCSWIISFSLAMLQPAILGISQKYTASIKVQEVTQMEIFFGMIGNVIGSIGIGYIAEIFSIEIAFYTMGIIAFLFLCVSIGMKITAPHSAHHENKMQEEHEKQEKTIIEHTHFHFRRHFG